MLTAEQLAEAVAADGDDDPTAAAVAFVVSYCTRGIPDPAPAVVVKVTRALARRLAANPEALRGVTAEGQSVDYPTTGLTYFESVLLNRYRRRTA